MMKRKPLSDLEIAGICRGLALLLHAGVALGDGLFLLAEEEQGPLRALLEELGRKLDDGTPLSDAALQSGDFPAYVGDMMRVGERSGRMEESLDALAVYYQDREETRRRVRSALTYPAVILLLMLAVVAVLLMRVLPVFDQVYASLGGQLTGIASGLLHLGQALESALPVLLVLTVLLVAGVIVFACCRSAREKMMGMWNVRMGDRGLGRRFSNARFARALAMGLSSGLPAEEAVELAAKLLEDTPQAAQRCCTCSQLLADGAELGRALYSSGVLPPSACRMLSLALRSGSGDQAMEEIARRMTEEAAQALDETVARIEPAMVLCMSLLVGMILLSVMLPLMNIMAAIG